MWQYNFTYLCHANNYKYVDKYRDKRGNWQYVYPDDVPQKARTMSIRNDKPTNALNKGYSGQDYGKSGNTRFANVKDQISLDIKSRAAARENEKKAADKVYRKAAYEGAKRADEEAAAKEAAGKTLGEGMKRYLPNEKRYVIDTETKKPLYLGEIQYVRDANTGVVAKAEHYRNPVKGSAGAKGARAKDLDDKEKRAKTSQMLKAATAKQKAEEKEAAERRVAESQNARESAIQKSAKQTQARNEYNKKASTAGMNAELERRRAGMSSEEKLDLLDQQAAIKGNTGIKDDVTKQARTLGSYNILFRELSDLTGYDIGTKTNTDNLAKKVAKKYVKQNKDASYDEVYDIMKRYINNVTKSLSTKDITEYISDDIFERLGLGFVKSNMDAKYKQASEESRRKYEEQHKANVEKTRKEYEDLYDKELRNIKKRY